MALRTIVATSVGRGTNFFSTRKTMLSGRDEMGTNSAPAAHIALTCAGSGSQVCRTNCNCAPAPRSSSAACDHSSSLPPQGAKGLTDMIVMRTISPLRDAVEGGQRGQVRRKLAPWPDELSAESGLANDIRQFERCSLNRQMTPLLIP